jgi:hypothetical protein
MLVKEGIVHLEEAGNFNNDFTCFNGSFPPFEPILYENNLVGGVT